VNRELEANTTLSHYRIVSKIGEGGMGEVYLAQDTKLDRRVAIKFLNQEFSKDEDKLNRFVREARAASALNHPNILTVYEIGEVDGQNYIATELIDGTTLRQPLRKEPLPLNTILKIGVQVAEALSAAHQAGIIHRDIKPENIMIRRDGYAKVLDFGLAKLSEPPAVAGGSHSGSEDATRIQVNTNPGVVMGTVNYMSPEQARGNPTDARTDIWSLGVVLFEMLARKVPFSGDTTSHTIVSILEKEPLVLENVPAELQRIVRKALTKDLDMRYQSARDLLIDLKNLRRDLDIQGELERSMIPNREATTATVDDKATQVYASGSLATHGGPAAAATQQPASASSLEYAVIQAKSHKLLTSIVALVLLAGVLTAGYFAFVSRSSSKGQINSIAVLPFQNNSGNPDSEYLSDGLTESLIYRLSQLPNLKVSPTSSVLRYKGKEIDPQKVASELGVSAVMSGRMLQRGDNLMISVELIDASNNKLIWGEQYERKMADLMTTQREIAAAITEKLQLKLSGDAATGVTKKYTNSNEAYQLYLKGRFNWNKRTSEGLQAAVQYYDQAIEKDPGFALAYAGLADTYVITGAYGKMSPSEAMPRAKAAALKAIELDNSLAEPHAALGSYYSGFGWNFETAERELRKATELNPNYATAWHWLGNFLPIIGKNDEAIAAGKRAEELDPLSAIISADTGWDLIISRRYDEAIEQAKHTQLIDPNFWYAHYIMGMAYDLKGMHPEAVQALRKSVELDPDDVTRGRLATALAHAGERAEAQKLLNELIAESGRRYVQGYYLATAQLALGDKDGALASLERDVRERGIYMMWLAINPEFDGLRGDTRFTALLEKMKRSKLD